MSRPGMIAASLLLACLSLITCRLPSLCAGDTFEPRNIQRWIAVAARGSGGGSSTLRAFDAAAPWSYVTPPLSIPDNCRVRFAFGRIFAVSPSAGSVIVIDPDLWTVLHHFSIAGQPADIAVVSPTQAYVSVRQRTQLVKLDLHTGATSPAADLFPFADSDGLPEMDALVIHRDRLFIGLQRINSSTGAHEPPQIAVVDIDTDQLIDADPATPGIQPIALCGTFPKGKMFVDSAASRLFVNAAGVFFDSGGIEMIDALALASLGLVVREADDNTGADLGSFTMTRPDAGYLVFSTDFALSSHLKHFTLAGGVDPGLELFVTLGYLSPVLLHDRRTDFLYMPIAGTAGTGVHVFDAAAGTRLTSSPIPSGTPDDLVLVYTGCGRPGDANQDDSVDAGDIQSFIECRASGALGCDCLDLDGNGRLDETDAALMVRLLLAS